MGGHLKNITVLVLAAGASTRMKEPKQLLPWKQTTLLQHTLDIAKNSKAKDIVLVLGAHRDLIESKINTKEINCIENKQWKLGMGSSIASGVNWIMENKLRSDGVLIILADQPFIDTTYLNKMIASFKARPDQIIATAYMGNAGVPALFNASFYPQLQRLKNDYGAKDMMKTYKDTLILLEATEKTMDIDTREAYKKLKDY